MTPDVNVLIAASRTDHPQHAVARAWLDKAISDTAHGATLTLQPMVIASFLRLVTHPRIFVQPTPISIALEFMDALLAISGVQQPLLGSEWPQLRKLCADQNLAANDLPDAWLAAAVVQQAEHLVTFDTDFRLLLPKNQYTCLKPMI